MNNEKNNNGRGIFYGVIGVATLVVAIIGATFAYFTATQSNNTAIRGNAASVSFGLKVERAETTDTTNGGLIPMSNTMVEQAVNVGGQPNGGAANTPCVDNNGNSVCQIYKVTLTNTSSASMFLDGYVTLTGGYQTSTDVASATTTMRWAQVFYSDSAQSGHTNYSTAGTTTLNADSEVTMTQIGADTATDNTGKNLANIYVGGEAPPTGTMQTAPTGNANFSSNPLLIINKNYIRISGHTGDSYARTDLTDALVFDQYLTAKDTANDETELYFVVWLSETGTNQTPNKESNGSEENFFSGNVVFNSGAGGEVSATFSGYTRVPNNSVTP